MSCVYYFSKHPTTILNLASTSVVYLKGLVYCWFYASPVILYRKCYLQGIVVFLVSYWHVDSEILTDYYLVKHSYYYWVKLSYLQMGKEAEAWTISTHMSQTGIQPSCLQMVKWIFVIVMCNNDWNTGCIRCQEKMSSLGWPTLKKRKKIQVSKSLAELTILHYAKLEVPKVGIHCIFSGQQKIQWNSVCLYGMMPLLPLETYNWML